MVFTTDSVLGVNLNQATPNALHDIGTSVTGTDNTVWLYVQASGDVPIGACDVDDNFQCTTGTGSYTADTAIPDESFGWVRQTATATGAAQGVVQQVILRDGDGQTGVGTFPLDDTIPQIGEGSEFLAQAFTPTNASHILNIEWRVHLGSTAAQHFVAALFRDAVSDALATSAHRQDAASFAILHGLHRMVAGQVTPITFRIRGGGNSGGAFFNQRDAGGRLYGGNLASYLMITELSITT